MNEQVVSSAPTNPRRLRVFLAEDDPDVVDSLTRILNVEGCDVVGKAATEMDALRWLESHPKGWDLAVLDLLLREGSGFNLLKQFASVQGSRAVVIYSAYRSEFVRQKTRDFGASATFSKLEGPQLATYARGFRQLLAAMP